MLLHDWNDVRLLLACARLGSFAKAAAAIGVDQSTASRRIKVMEQAVGRPLFTRRRSGASPTPAGLALIERAKVMEAAAAEFESALSGLVKHPSPTVTVAASEGLLTYTLVPALIGSDPTPLSIDRSLIRQPLPPLAFATPGQKAEITILSTNPGEVPAVRGAMRVRKIGAMSMVPVAHQAFLSRHPVRSFDDLRHLPLVDNALYHRFRGLEAWNAVVAEHDDPARVRTVATTPEMHGPIMAAQAVAIGPNYTPLYRSPLVVLDVALPRLSVDLWLVAHEDALREPEVRQLYDLLGAMFLQSSWYREPR